MSGNISINFKPSLKQQKALDYLFDNQTLFIGYGGSAFSGKSYLLCYWLTIMCIAYPETFWGLGRKELVTLKKTTLLTLFKVFKESNIKAGIHYNYNQQSNSIIFQNGSIIFLIDMAHKPSDPLYTRFGGLELTGAAIDESSENHYKAIEILFTRLGRKNNQKYGICKKMLETFNPSKNHVYIRYYKPYKENKQTQETVFVPALPKDNPSPEVNDYINGIIKTADKTTIERLIYGNFEFDNDPAKLIEFDKIQNCFTNDFVEGGEKYLSADVARFGSDKMVIMVWNGFRVEEIFSMDKSSITEIADHIKRLSAKHKVPLSNIIADADGVGGGLVDILKCNEFVNNARPLEEDGNAVQYQNLKTQCYYKLASLIQTDQIYINCNDMDVKNTIIEELEQVKRDKVDHDGKLKILPKEKVKELIGRSPDFSDALMMRMFFEVGHRFTFSIK